MKNEKIKLITLYECTYFNAIKSDQPSKTHYRKPQIQLHGFKITFPKYGNVKWAKTCCSNINDFSTLFLMLCAKTL